MGYLYECHGDFFDAYDDHVAHAEGYRYRGGQSTFCDPVLDRERNIRAMHNFNRNVARLEEGRMVFLENE